MENDVLRNKIAPWQAKGRWYHGFFDYSTSSLVPEKTDKFIIDNFTLDISSPNVLLRCGNIGIRPLAVHYKLSSDYTRSVAGNFTPNISYLYSDGRQSVTIAPIGTAGTCEFWVFLG